MLTVSGAMLVCSPALLCAKGRDKCMKLSVAAAMMCEDQGFSCRRGKPGRASALRRALA